MCFPLWTIGHTNLQWEISQPVAYRGWMNECVFIYRIYHIVSQGGLQFYLSEIRQIQAPWSVSNPFKASRNFKYYISSQNQLESIWLYENPEQDCLWKSLHYSNRSGSDACVSEITRQNPHPRSFLGHAYWTGTGRLFYHVDEQSCLREANVSHETQRW